ncbi:ABC transporter ATP-binding protein [Microbacterium sp. zg.Y625]|uniref:ABC transporter ATP-binding protein n=1 Tax=Microbacterium jiangjiandongii TaxID=3049071 RepID=UPI00214AFE52|nr:MULTISPECIES: ABC transporter ATP-binding protein [unclassified Microbacterium]MCR2793468.1 ABC transporter ATP-binding protein [Microbacterium sp. zg.Y625]WIM25162.1 ABC transporter ATP-binding protein [Microbacterium sp. zg-Y625]
MVAGITVSNLTKGFGSTTVVDGLDLEVEQGEILVLLGPSGCGKTTTLRCLAGLETPSEGSIRFDGTPVFDDGTRVNVPINKRNIGMVFQSYALWPHMTVRQNIAYPLKVRRMKKAIAEGWVERAADMVHCGNLLDRYPAQLSGGQQQRIALARGLVSQPSVVLLDEPLSNLDAKLRDQVRTEIRELHQQLRFTAVLVTHDQEEALALGDRVAIMKDGRIEQLDTPEALFLAPATEYVAGFVGMSNRLEWTRSDGTWAGPAGLRVPAPVLGVDGDRAVSLIRPDDLTLHPAKPGAADDALLLDATLVTAEYGGRHVDVTLTLGDASRLHARTGTGASEAWIRTLQPGAPVAVSVPHRSLHSYRG